VTGEIRPIRVMPGSAPPRNGLPDARPYRWNGDRVASPAEIVAALHAEIEARQLAKLSLFMSRPCLYDGCKQCTDARCRCGCHDEPLRPAGRCRRCGYLTSARGHAVSCGSGGR